MDGKQMAEWARFEYALQFPDGKFYTGNYDLQKGERYEAYLYTEHGAHLKLTQPGFEQCKVVRIL